MRKIFDNILKNRIDINFLDNNKIEKYILDENYQIVEVCQPQEWTKNHRMFSIHLTPNNFRYEYKKVLNKKKKIIVLGEWHHMVAYYRFLKYNGYSAYLIKDKKYEKMILGITSNFENRKLKNKIIRQLKQNKNIKVVNLSPLPLFNYFNESKKIYKKWKAKKIDCGIFIDTWGTLPFMILSKKKGMLAANIGDNFSATMAKQHNNAGALIFATKSVIKEEIVPHINAFLAAEYEGGRHNERLELLDTILKGEK